MEKAFKLIAVVLIASVFASCGTPATQDKKDVFAVLGEDFELLGATWNVSKIIKATDVHDETSGVKNPVPYWPQQGFFYTILIDIKPKEKMVIQPQFLRFEIVDVYGQRYFATEDFAALAVQAKNLKREAISQIKRDISNPLAAFLLMDVVQNMRGVTLEIIQTGGTQDRRLAVVDLKE